MDVRPAGRSSPPDEGVPGVQEAESPTRMVAHNHVSRQIAITLTGRPSEIQATRRETLKLCRRQMKSMTVLNALFFSPESQAISANIWRIANQYLSFLFINAMVKLRTLKRNYYHCNNSSISFFRKPSQARLSRLIIPLFLCFSRKTSLRV